MVVPIIGGILRAGSRGGARSTSRSKDGSERSKKRTTGMAERRRQTSDNSLFCDSIAQDAAEKTITRSLPYVVAVVKKEVPRGTGATADSLHIGDGTWSSTFTSKYAGEITIGATTPYAPFIDMRAAEHTFQTMMSVLELRANIVYGNTFSDCVG